jgi:glycosyltransferase involved in cell wall biosynthesis
MFSIVIACYNQKHFVRAAVESAIAQRAADKEVIAVDDASSDGTGEVLQAFSSSIQVVRFAKNQGALAARNHGAALARGEYLVFLDGDDALMPWALEVYDRLIAEHSPTLVLGKRRYFRDQVPNVVPEDIPHEIRYVSYPSWFYKDREVAFGASTFVVRREAFWDAGGWSPEIFHLDISDLLLKLGLAGRTLVIVEPSTAWYRIHSANATRALSAMIGCARLLLAKERRGEYPGGRKYVLARATCLGGPILYWIRRAAGAGLRIDALRLAGSAWRTILAAIVRRAVVLCKGRQPVQAVGIVLQPRNE